MIILGKYGYFDSSIGNIYNPNKLFLFNFDVFLKLHFYIKPQTQKKLCSEYWSVGRFILFVL